MLPSKYEDCGIAQYHFDRGYGDALAEKLPEEQIAALLRRYHAGGGSVYLQWHIADRLVQASAWLVFQTFELIEVSEPEMLSIAWLRMAWAIHGRPEEWGLNREGEMVRLSRAIEPLQKSVRTWDALEHELIKRLMFTRKQWGREDKQEKAAVQGRFRRTKLSNDQDEVDDLFTDPDRLNYWQEQEQPDERLAQEEQAKEAARVAAIDRDANIDELNLLRSVCEQPKDFKLIDNLIRLVAAGEGAEEALRALRAWSNHQIKQKLECLRRRYRARQESGAQGRSGTLVSKDIKNSSTSSSYQQNKTPSLTVPAPLKFSI
jgi:hypothetical protein